MRCVSAQDRTSFVTQHPLPERDAGRTLCGTGRGVGSPRGVPVSVRFGVRFCWEFVSAATFFFQSASAHRGQRLERGVNIFRGSVCCKISEYSSCSSDVCVRVFTCAREFCVCVLFVCMQTCLSGTKSCPFLVNVFISLKHVRIIHVSTQR